MRRTVELTILTEILVSLDFFSVLAVFFFAGQISYRCFDFFCQRPLSQVALLLVIQKKRLSCDAFVIKEGFGRDIIWFVICSTVYSTFLFLGDFTESEGIRSLASSF